MINLNKRFRSKSLNAHSSSIYTNTESKSKETSTQCNLNNYRLSLKIASYLLIPREASFLECQIVKTSKPSTTLKKNSKIEKKSASIQTYTLLNENKTTRLIEEILINLVEENNVLTNSTICLFIDCLEKLSSQSIEFLHKNLNDLHALHLIESLIKLNRTNKLKYLDATLKNKYETLSSSTSNSNENLSLENLIRLIETSRFGVRFNSSEEKRKQALNRFKRAVRFVIINKEWFKTMHKEKSSREEHFKLLAEYTRLNENSAELNKKIQMLFNKDDFKVKKNVTSVISDMQRRILAKDKYKRTNEQLESLQEVLNLIPRLNALPRHLFTHVAQLLTLVVYEKGREIVREGHKAFGFYFITNGSCDVFSVGTDGLIKIDELSSGDTFGENSFKETTPYTPHTIITNTRTELIMVIPSDIETYLSRLHEQERIEKRSFITNWWHAKYWNWSPESVEAFVNAAQFLRYSNEEVIIDSSHETLDKFYFILRGNVQLVRALTRTTKKKTKKKTLVKVCTLEKENYFGVEEMLTSNTWYIAQGDTDLIAIDKTRFLSLNKHASFLVSQLIEDFKLAISNYDIEIISFI